MTNYEIIKNVVIEKKLLGEKTEEKIKKYEEAGIALPIHTFRGWQKEFYKVREEELSKPCAVVPLWNTYRDSEGKKHFRKDKAKLYLVNQCVKMKKEED